MVERNADGTLKIIASLDDDWIRESRKLRETQSDSDEEAKSTSLEADDPNER